MIGREDAAMLPLRNLIRGRFLTGRALAKVLKKAPGTGRKRLEHPEDLTVAELFRLVDSRQIQAEELLNALRFNRGGMKE